MYHQTATTNHLTCSASTVLQIVPNTTFQCNANLDYITSLKNEIQQLKSRLVARQHPAMELRYRFISNSGNNHQTPCIPSSSAIMTAAFSPMSNAVE